MMEIIEQPTEVAFGKNWWKGFMRQTRNLSEPAVLENVFSSEKLAFFTQKVLEILATVKTSQYGYRVFVDEKLLGPSEMDAFFQASPAQGESLAAWAERAFAGRNFGIILNNSDKFNHELAKDVAGAMEPFFSAHGHPRGGVQTTIFIGNYDRTPIGIHQDARGESVLHFHVGPGEKTMYVWDKDEYESLLEDNDWTKKDVDALKPFAKRYHFRAGDVYYMPEGTYHIGEQTGLAIGITIWTYCHTDDLLIQNLHQKILEQIPVKKTPDFKHDANPLDDTSALDDAILKYALTAECKDLNYSDLLRKTYQDWRYGIHSNGGYRNQPITRDKEDKPDFQRHDRIQAEVPFRILIRESVETGKMYLYVRGHKIEFRHFPCLISLIERINDGQEHRIADLLDLLDPNWPDAIGLYLLSELYRCYGIVKLGC